MAGNVKRQRTVSLVLLGTLALAVYYVAVFKPLSQRARSLDRPLTQLWDKLVATNESATAVAGMNLENYVARSSALERVATNLAAAELLIRKRIEWPQQVQEQMAAQFRLIEFQNERLQRIAQLAALAQERKAAIEPGATNGLPEYAADTVDPVWLWPRLHMAGQIWLTALHSKVTVLRSMTQLPNQGQLWPSPGIESMIQLPVRLELVGPMESLAVFLSALPLQGEELQRVGLATLTNKPALFIDQILIRKGVPERPAEAQLEVTVVGVLASTNSVFNPSRPES
jgi:hypothetical protein